MLPFINAGHRFVPILIDLFGSHAALMATIACCGCCRTTEQGARFSAASGVSDQQAAGPRPAGHQEPTTRTVQSSTVRYTSNQDQIVGLLIPACPGCWLRAGWLGCSHSRSLSAARREASQAGSEQGEPSRGLKSKNAGTKKAPERSRGMLGRQRVQHRVAERHGG